MFFLPKNQISKTVVKNAVYKSNKSRDIFVTVCAVSKPDMKSITDADSTNRYAIVPMMSTRGLHDATGNATIYRQLSDNTFHHRKRACSKNIVMIRRIDVLDDDLFTMTLSDFLDEFELVIGYTSDDEPIVESEIKSLRNIME